VVPTWRHVVAAAVLALTGAPASVANVGPGHFTSPNVTWVANVPLDAPAIGGRVLTVGGQKRFYVSSTKGLSIYDVTNPALPVILGTLAMPHFENESVAVSDDGNTVLLSSDPDFGQPPLVYIVDTTLVTVPHVVGVIPNGSHTVTCANAACSHVYGNFGWIYDITDRSAPHLVTSNGPGATHYASRDGAGLLWDTNRMIDPRTNPANPTVTDVGTGGWHNNLRPNAAAYVTRSPGDSSLPLRAGELVIGGDETWLGPGVCSTAAAAVTSWSIVNFDKGVKAKKVGTIRPRNGNYSDGSPIADVVGCSSHWFDYRNGMVAAGWYDHGVRFIKVDEATGALTEAGFFLPVANETWGAYWIDDEYVYSVDAVRGIDILRFDRSAPLAPSGALDDSWQRTTFSPSAATIRERFVCRPRERA
jgi:hypothetical protein